MIIVQLCPQLNSGGVERGVVDVAVYLKQIGCTSIVISDGGVMVSELYANQVKHIQLPIHSKNPLRFLLNLWRLKQVLGDLKPDLLLPYSRIPTWLIYFLRKKVKAPFISHCLGIHRMGGFGIKTKYNSVLMQGTRVIANSNFTKAYFLNHYPSFKQPVIVIPRSVDSHFFNQNNHQLELIHRLRHQWRVASGKFVVLLPARFTYWKGHEVLISALRLLKQTTNDFYLVMIGDYHVNTSYYKRLMTLMKVLNLSDDIFFAGPSTNMYDVYAAADIVISASTEPEAFGRTIIEAQSMGKLVVASRHGGALETIEDNITGFLVEPGNASELADTLLKIYHMSPFKKNEIITNAKKNAEYFSKKKMCEQLVEFYKELVNKQSESAGFIKNG